MINILYCQTHNIVIAADESCNSGFHIHGGLEEEAILIQGIDEPNYNGTVGFITSDGTIINNSNKWLMYLEKYLP